MLAAALQRELLVGHALERQAVQRRDAEALDRVAVLRGRVAHVRGELPAGVHGVGAVHEPVARDLRDDRRGRDGGAGGVAVDDRALLVAEVGHREAVDQAEGARPRDAEQRVAQRGEVGAVQAAAVDAAHAPRHRVDLDGGAQDEREQPLTGLDVVLLGVVQRAERADVGDRERLEVEEDGRGDERTGEAAAAGLVGPGDPADAQPAVELEQAPAGAALGLAAPPRGAGLGLRGGRCGWGASRWRRRPR
jgi:hypothetical protein